MNNGKKSKIMRGKENMVKDTIKNSKEHVNVRERDLRKRDK